MDRRDVQWGPGNRCLVNMTHDTSGDEFIGIVLQLLRMRGARVLGERAWWYPEGPLTRSLERRCGPMSGIGRSAPGETGNCVGNDSFSAT